MATRMALIGNVGPYDKNVEDFKSYSERVTLFMTANDVKEEKQVAVFLSVLGAQTYKLLKSLLTPESLEKKSVDELIKVLETHFSPKHLVIAERFRFWRRDQLEGESITQYSAELRRLSTHCKFDTFLPQALRDRLVCGLGSDSIQKKLLSEEKLSFERAMEISLAMEIADRQSKEFKTGHSTNRVQASGSSSPKSTWSKGTNRGPTQGQGKQKTSTPQQNNSGSGKPPTPVCRRCGKGPHSPDVCRYKKYRCKKCKQVGHLKVMCKNATKYVSQEDPNDDQEDYYGHATGTNDPFGLFQVTSGKIKYKPIIANLNVAGETISMEVDTGASMTIIPESLFNDKLSEIKLEPCNQTFFTYSGEPLQVLGQAEVPVEYEGQSVKLPLVVAKIKGQPAILGRNWLYELKLNWKVFKVTGSDIVGELKSTYPSVFKDGLGTVKGHQVQIHMKEDSKPIFCKARPVPYALKPKVDEELKRLESEGVITKVDRSDWASPIVVVPKSDGSIRLCCDFKVSINQCIDVEQYPLPTTEDLFSTLAGGQYFSKLDLSSAYQQLLV